MEKHQPVRVRFRCQQEERNCLCKQHREKTLSRKRKWLATAIAAAATSKIFEPVIRKVGCTVLSSIGYCQDRRARKIENLYQQIKHLTERVQALEEGTWRTFVIEPPKDPTHWNDPSSHLTSPRMKMHSHLCCHGWSCW